MTAWRFLAVAAVAVLAVSCKDNGTATVTSPTGVTFSTEYFSNVIESGGSRFYSFKVATAGPVTVTLASITNADSGLPLGRPLRVGVGRPAGTGCPAQTSALVQAALTTQVTHLAPEGVNCIEIADPSGLPGPIRFAIRFTHP